MAAVAPKIGAYPLPEEEQFEVGHREYPQDAGYHFQHEDRFSALPFRFEVVAQQKHRDEDAEYGLRRGQYRPVRHQFPVGQQIRYHRGGLFNDRRIER